MDLVSDAIAINRSINEQRQLHVTAAAAAEGKTTLALIHTKHNRDINKR